MRAVRAVCPERGPVAVQVDELGEFPGDGRRRAVLFRQATGIFFRVPGGALKPYEPSCN